MRHTRIWRRLLCMGLALMMMLGMAVPAASADTRGREELTVEKVDSDAVTGERLSGEPTITPKGDIPVNDPIGPDQQVRVSILLEKPSTIEAGFSTRNIASNDSAIRYRSQLLADQMSVQRAIEAALDKPLDVVWNLTLAANIISANVAFGEIEAIEGVDGVAGVFLEREYVPAETAAGSVTLQPNMAVSGTMNGAGTAWNLGFRGQGTVIAVIDTGVDDKHQSFDPDAFRYAIGENAELKVTKDTLQKNLAFLHVDGRTAEELYVNEKIPFGYNYADKNLDISHLNDAQTEHGSHVAGIAAANRYIKRTGADGETEYVDALSEVKMAGNAPDAQILAMKVFGASGSKDSDYVAAIEDAITLGADAVNLSLGMALPGFATPAGGDPYARIQQTLVESDTVVVFSSGNSGNWAANTAPGYLYSDGVSYQMDGESGSFTNSFTVASVDNMGLVSPSIAVDGKEYTYIETLYVNPPLGSLDTSGRDGEGVELAFLMLATQPYGDGGGNEAEALGEIGSEAIRDKAVIVWRGENSFSEKANIAAQYGAKAVIVVNNEDGALAMDLSDYTGSVPVVSITRAAGEAIFQTGEIHDLSYSWYDTTYSTGTLRIRDVHVIAPESETVTVSDFSSWGIPGSLELKPEISAPGGNIWSVYGATPGHEGTGDYELMSGTSMAAPQVSGMAALVQQHLEECAADPNSGLTIPGDVTRRALTQGLLMSTAAPMKDAEGNYYPLMQQGAGLANVANAVSTPVYVTVKGQTDGKVKAELGDDFDREGVYRVEFTLHNMSAVPRSYTLSADAFTQAVKDGMYLDYTTRPLDYTVSFTGSGIISGGTDLAFDFNGDGELNRADAQLLLDAVISGSGIPENGDVNGDGSIDTLDVHDLLNTGNTVTVPAGGAVTVTAEIALTDAEKKNLNNENSGGAYIEAYISAVAESDAEGVLAPTLSIPVLAYYGSWTDASMFDLGDGEEWYNTLVAGGDAYVEEGKWEGDRMPYTAHEFYDFYHAGEATNLLVEDDSHIIFNHGTVGPETGELSYYYTLIRNAGNGILRITYDNYGTEILWQSADLGPEYGVVYMADYGMWFRADMKNNLFYNLFSTADFDWQKALKALPEGVDELTFELIMAPEYYAGEDGSYDWEALTDGDSDNGELGQGAYLRTTVSVDNTPPVMVDATYAKNAQGETVLYITAKDDISVTDITLWGDDGETLCYEYNETVYNAEDFDDMAGTGTPNFTPTGPGQETTVRFDGQYKYDFAIAFWYDLIVFDERVATLKDDVYLVEIRDSAGNTGAYRVFVNKTETDRPEDVTDVWISDTELEITLGSSYRLTAAANPIVLKDRTVTWTSSNEEVAKVDSGGLVTGLKPGNAVITAKSNQNPAVSTACRVTVYTVPVTLRGILGDTDGEAKFFTWNMAGNELKRENLLPVETPLAATGDGKGGYYVLDAGYTMTHVGADGQILSSVPNWTNAEENAVPFDMAYSERAGGLFMCYGYYIIGPVSPDEPLPEELDAFDLSGDTRAWLYGIDILEKHWEADGHEGEWYIAAVDDLGYAWELCPYESDYSEGLSAVYEDYPLVGMPEILYGDIPYSSLIAADGENWYYSVRTGNTSAVYRLTFTELEDDSEYDWGLVSTRLGDAGEGVWPALLLEISTGETEIQYDFNNDGVANRDDAQLLLDHVVKGTEIQHARNDVDVDGDNGVDTRDVYELLNKMENKWSAASRISAGRNAMDAEQIRAQGLENLKRGEAAAAAALAGGLDQVDVGADGDIVKNEVSRSIEVPVYAGGSGNGLFTVTYDTENLAFEGFAPGTMLTSAVVDEEKGTITVGFAALSTEEKEAVVTLTFRYERAAVERQATLTLSVSEDGSQHMEPPVTAQRTVTLPAEAERVTVTGVMRDAEDQETYLYTWNLENNTFTKGQKIAVKNPVGVGDNGDQFYMYAKDDNMYLIDKTTGQAVGDPWRLKIEEGWFGDEYVIPWAMTATSKGLHWGSDEYVYLADTVSGSTTAGVWSFDVLEQGFYPYAMAAVDGAWENNGKSGDLTVYVFTDGSKIVKFSCYKDGESYRYVADAIDTDLPASNLMFGDQFIEGEGSNYYGSFYPYSTLAVGEDGALYLAAMRGDPEYDAARTELYKLTYDETRDMYVSDLLGTQNTYPFLLLNVAANGSHTLVGGLDSIAAEDSGEEAGSGAGIVVDGENHTVTVPVYAANSTNGEFILTYDPDVLILDSVTGVSSVLTSYDAGTAGQVHAGYAERQAVNQKVFTLVFRYTAGGETALKLNVVQDGYSREETVLPYTVTLPGTGGDTPVTPPAPAAPENPNVTTDTTVENGRTVTETVAVPGVSTKDGTASAAVSAAMGDEIVKQATAHDSDAVVIAPKFPMDANSAQVTIPGETLAGLASRTGADLRVETPVGVVTIPHMALAGLGEGRTVNVTLQRTGDAVKVEIAVDGRAVETVPGGLKLILPLRGGQVAVLVGADGGKTLLPKSLVEDGMTFVLLDGPGTVELVDNGKTFNDLAAGAWYTSAVAFASSHELFNGTGGGQFSPDAPMDRAMMATVLWRLERGEPPVGGKTFTDVGDNWYADVVAWASGRGIVKGYGDGTFRPENSVTREEMAVILYRYAAYVGLDVTGQADLGGYMDEANVSDWAETAVKWAVSSGLIKGQGGGQLNPTGLTSRAEVAAVLLRLVRLMVK